MRLFYTPKKFRRWTHNFLFQVYAFSACNYSETQNGITQFSSEKYLGELYLLGSKEHVAEKSSGTVLERADDHYLRLL